ncbi:MAG: protein phosphatase 2C domain-containing protein [Thermoanaerobaculia bacterium]
MLRARACGLSDVGVLRSHNEDCFEIDPERQMYVVADGMGGHSHGEIASRIAVQAIREYVATSAPEDPGEERGGRTFHRSTDAQNNWMRDAIRPGPRAGHQGDPTGRFAARYGNDGRRAAARRRPDHRGARR